MQARGRAEAGWIDDVADTSVKTLDQAISSRMTWRNQAVPDIRLLAQPVEQVLPAGALFLPLAMKRSVSSQVISTGQAARALVRKSTLSLLVRSTWISMNTQRVARSMATNR